MPPISDARYWLVPAGDEPAGPRREQEGGSVARRGAREHLSAARQRLRDWTLTALLGVQVLIIFCLGPLMAYGLPVTHTVAGFIFVLVVFVVIIAAPSIGPMIAVVSALVFDAGSAVMLRMPGVTVETYWMNAVGTVLSIAGVSWVVVQIVFSPGPIDRHRIIGAIVLYLNAALMFAGLFRLVQELDPRAFAGLPLDTGMREASGDLIYFSMATLTTVGYGDIVPVHPLARSLANLEGLVGQLYPAIILARIMGLYRSG